MNVQKITSWNILSLFTTSSNSFYIQERLYLFSDVFHEFTDDTDTMKFIISVGKFKSLNSDVTIKLTNVSI